MTDRMTKRQRLARLEDFVESIIALARTNANDIADIFQSIISLRARLVTLEQMVIFNERITPDPTSPQAPLPSGEDGGDNGASGDTGSLDSAPVGEDFGTPEKRVERRDPTEATPS